MPAHSRIKLLNGESRDALAVLKHKVIKTVKIVKSSTNKASHKPAVVAMHQLTVLNDGRGTRGFNGPDSLFLCYYLSIPLW